jgi:putative acetyltransferase
VSEALIELRRRHDGDGPALAETWVRSWAEARPDLDFEARRPWIVQRIAELEAEGAVTLVALVHGVVAGAVMVNPSTLYLDQIWVAPSAKGHGLAGRLLAAARALSPGGIDLHVNQDNARAIGFYLREGFAVSGTDVNPRSGAPIYKMSWRPDGCSRADP